METTSGGGELVATAAAEALDDEWQWRRWVEKATKTTPQRISDADSQFGCDEITGSGVSGMNMAVSNDAYRWK